MALRLASGAPFPEQGREASPGIGKQGIAADQVAQLPFSLHQVPQLEGGQGSAGAGHGKTGPGIGRRRETGPGRQPVAAGALHVPEVVEGGSVGGIARQDPAVISLGGIPLAQGLLGGAAVEVGIALAWIKGDGPALVSDGSLGIAQGQVYVLYDTKAVAWRYQRAIDAVRAALRTEVERGNQE